MGAKIGAGVGKGGGIGVDVPRHFPWLSNLDDPKSILRIRGLARPRGRVRNCFLDLNLKQLKRAVARCKSRRRKRNLACKDKTTWDNSRNSDFFSLFTLTIQRAPTPYPLF